MKPLDTTAIVKVAGARGFLHCAVFTPDGPVGDPTFRAVSFQGQEQVSTPFEYKIELRADTDEGQPAFDWGALIGRPVTVGIDRPFALAHGTPDPLLSSRRFAAAVAGRPAQGLALFNGIVAAFGMQEPGVYRLTMRPALWKLTLTNRYRIHQRCTIRECIERLLDAHYPDVEYSMQGVADPEEPANARRQDWLQAGESDYEFVQRLMAKVQMFYYFEHGATGHRAVFATAPSYPPLPDFARPLRFASTSIEPLEQDDVVRQYSYERTLASSGVQGTLVRQNESWHDDAVSPCDVYPSREFEASSPADAGERPHSVYRVYQYGGSAEQARLYVTRTHQALSAAASSFSGGSSCPQLRVGHRFQLVADQDRQNRPYPLRPQFDGRWFVATQVQHQASADGAYSNEFQATEADGLIAPFNPADTRQGSILAEVVDAGGGKPPSDWRFYPRTAFDPELNPLTDSTAVPPTLHAKGVYVRFTSGGAKSPKVWVKLAPHMHGVPEIGAQVIVSRAGDDSEVPEIQSLVDAPGTMTVTPSRWTTSTNVGSNYSTAYGDGQSIRFGARSKADLQRAIGIVDGQYASGKFRETSFSQGASYGYSTAEEGKYGLLDERESWGSTHSRSYGGESRSYAEIDQVYSEQHNVAAVNKSTVTGKSYNESVVGESEQHNTVKGKSSTYSTTGGKTHTESTSADVDQYSTVNGKSYNRQTVNGTSETHSTVNGKSINDNVVNGNSVNTSAVTGISLSKQYATVSTNESLTLMQTNANYVGVSKTDQLTGAAANTNITGATLDMSLLGESVGMKIAGVTSELSVTELVASVSDKSAVVSVETTGLGVSVSMTAAVVECKVVGMTVNVNAAIELWI